MKRRPRVAGMFYPADPASLREMVAGFFARVDNGGDNALGVVSPHAGYVYSGQIAAYAYSSFGSDFDGTFVIVGPSHSGYSTCASAIPWETPLGTAPVDDEFIRYLDLTIDEFSHRDEHSIEVQIPFIQYRFPVAKIAPILMGEQSLASALHLAEKITAAAEKTGIPVRIVASSDFSHYIPDETAKRQDLYAIEALETLDVEEFFRRIWEEGVSACGYGPIASMVTACRAAGARNGRLVRYGTSAEVSGDYSQVVGYAAIAVI
ncbi:MAG: AmmeMemoRadiSam system protein B [Methanomicrobiaceae archaeon]|nr:AmmeMemoRadiSam system protein B [Methanomicrobiaceae archaeon]